MIDELWHLWTADKTKSTRSLRPALAMSTNMDLLTRASAGSIMITRF
jgi:hypothetical protein